MTDWWCHVCGREVFSGQRCPQCLGSPPPPRPPKPAIPTYRETGYFTWPSAVAAFLALLMVAAVVMARALGYL